MGLSNLSVKKRVADKGLRQATPAASYPFNSILEHCQTEQETVYKFLAQCVASCADSVARSQARAFKWIFILNLFLICLFKDDLELLSAFLTNKFRVFICLSTSL